MAEATADAAGGRTVLWLPTFDAAEPVLRGLLRDGDLCLVLGAGDVDELGRRLVAPGSEVVRFALAALRGAYCITEGKRGRGGATVRGRPASRGELPGRC